MLKRCSSCKVDKPITEFYSHKDTTDKLRPNCKVCVKVYNKAHGLKPEVQERRSRKHVLKTYGLTPATYDALLVEQGHTCAICKRTCSTGRRLSVDHDHVTGAVRGLLCGNCNTAIGKLRDDPALMRRAADYVERHSVHNI
jgi:hypothetical protein